jgi:HlyD family secretion protein
MIRRVLVLVLVSGLLAAGGGWFMWRQPAEAGGYQGYVEGNLAFIAPETAGRIEALSVDAGDMVAAGQPLFALDASMEIAQANEAKAKLQQARAQLDDFNAALQRPEQIAVLRAQEERAQAQRDFSRSELDRQKILFGRGYSAQARLDQAQAAFERDQAALDEIRRLIEAGQISGRGAEIRSAEAAVQVAEAAVGQAHARLAKRRVSAPTEARVQDVFFRVGEVVIGGQPVLALLPPGNRRIRFYVPEPELSTIRLGQGMALACDSCPSGLSAKVTFISGEAEFTPPVIFSDKERAKLVFRVEAQPTDSTELPVGLPVSVMPVSVTPLESGA